MNEKQLGIEGLSDATRVVITAERAAAVGVNRSTTAGEIRQKLNEKKNTVVVKKTETKDK